MPKGATRFHPHWLILYTLAEAHGNQTARGNSLRHTRRPAPTAPRSRDTGKRSGLSSGLPCSDICTHSVHARRVHLIRLGRPQQTFRVLVAPNGHSKQQTTCCTRNSLTPKRERERDVLQRCQREASASLRGILQHAFSDRGPELALLSQCGDAALLETETPIQDQHWMPSFCLIQAFPCCAV